MASLNPSRAVRGFVDSFMPGTATALGDPNIGQSLAATEGAIAGLTPELPALDVPAVSAAKAMPTPDDSLARKARRRSLAEQMQRRGRASTILTADDTLGG